jgi:peptide/nickel transport system permease protein
VRKVVTVDAKGRQNVALVFSLDYPYGGFPEELYIHFTAAYERKKPFVELTWVTPDGREFDLGAFAVVPGDPYIFAERIPPRYLTEGIRRESVLGSGQGGAPPVQVLFADPGAAQPVAVEGTYTLRIDGLLFEAASDLDARIMLLGAVYGPAGTDHLRRDLSIPLLWGAPVALGLGLLGAGLTTLISVLVAAAGSWLGGWADGLVQRLIEANMILPLLGVGVLLTRLYGIGLWTIMGLFVLLNAFGSPAKAYRAAFLQFKEAPYLEAARAYGAGHWRIVRHYLIPRIVPVLVPQLVVLVPSYVFLESTLAIFNVSHRFVPSWGRLIYDAVKVGAFRGEFWWLLEPIGMLMLTGLAFVSLGFALDRILQPRLRAR